MELNRATDHKSVEDSGASLSRGIERSRSLLAEYRRRLGLLAAGGCAASSLSRLATKSNGIQKD